MADQAVQQQKTPTDIAANGRLEELTTSLIKLLATPGPSQTFIQKIAIERAGRDIQAANESSRAAAQAALLINGGAATAILAYLSKEASTPKPVLSAAAWALIGYAVGVFCIAVSMWCSSQAAAQFGYAWESTADSDDPARARFVKAGKHWLLGHRIFIVAGLVLFLASSCWIASAFLDMASKVQ